MLHYNITAVYVWWIDRKADGAGPSHK
jgi:hypothetical protein